MNVTMEDIVVFPEVSDIIVKRADYIRSKFFLKQWDYGEVFTKILQYKIAEFNLAYKDGFSLE